MSEYKLYQGDCIEVMKDIEDGSVDLILTDPPYGTTACKWDSVIPFEPMWEQLNRIIKPNGAICLFGNEPFTSCLICSNIKGFKYRWDWNKKIPSGMGYAKYRPMQQTEDICVFSKNGEKTKYNPQFIKRDKPIKSGGNSIQARVYSGFKCMEDGKEYKKTYDYKNPVTLIEFDKVRKGALHPTQKPVPLLEYLIRTYTNEGETVLDFTMGSGSTGVAALNTNRNFIGIELDEEYFKIAENRIKQAIIDKGVIIQNYESGYLEERKGEEMIETTIYKCEYCGAEFDDWYTANCHEWLCRYKDVKNRDGSNLRFYKEDGTESKFDNAEFVQDGFDDVESLTIGNDSDVKFIADFFEWHDYDNPFRAIADEANPNYYGLWCFDPDLNDYGQWVRVDDQIKRWTDIKNKFEKGT